MTLNIAYSVIRVSRSCDFMTSFHETVARKKGSNSCVDRNFQHF